MSALSEHVARARFARAKARGQWKRDSYDRRLHARALPLHLRHWRLALWRLQLSHFLLPMFALARAQRATVTQVQQVTVQTRELRKGRAIRKPRLRLKFDLDGNPKVPTFINGWDADQREKYIKWLQRTSEKISREIGQKSGERCFLASSIDWDSLRLSRLPSGHLFFYFPVSIRSCSAR